MHESSLTHLKHVVVLMMSNRSFDHMLGGLKEQDPRIDGLTGNESNPDTTGTEVKVAPLAEFQGQLDRDPDLHFPGVDLQIFNGDTTDTRVANMKGFVKSYYNQQRDVGHSRKIMYYFRPEKLPVLTTLATEFAVFNRWFSSIPGPGACNRLFAHYGTSFGAVGNQQVLLDTPYKSIYERMINAGRTAKIYLYDRQSSMSVAPMLAKEPQLFGTYDQFLADCQQGTLPEYSFIEPNHNDHLGDAGVHLGSDQHPDHNVQMGELFIASVYNAIRENSSLWQSTALLILYDEHGGIYDHVPPPACTPDGFLAVNTGTSSAFAFDRLGVRVPAVLVSPWIPKGTVVDGRIFEHASIPASLTHFFLGEYDSRSPREKSADTFLDLLSLRRMRMDTPSFDVGTELFRTTPISKEDVTAKKIQPEIPPEIPSRPVIAGYRSDVASGEDLLDVAPEVETLCAVLAAKDVEPPISIGLFGDWGSGKTFFMKQMQNEFNRIKNALVNLARKRHIARK